MAKTSYVVSFILSVAAAVPMLTHTTRAKTWVTISFATSLIFIVSAIVFGYELWLVNTKDHTSHYGFLLPENKQSLVTNKIYLPFKHLRFKELLWLEFYL